MKHDLFNLYNPFNDLSPDAPQPVLTTALRTSTDDAGVRTLRYCGDVVGHYQRAKTHRHNGPLWRGVTHSGAIVYGRTELSVRRELLERYA